MPVALTKTIERLCGLPDLTDGELLSRFLQEKDARAFEALLRRHGPLVLSVCHRILRNAADAEDAFQATFLVLLRTARSIRKPQSLASWLHGVARRTALHAKRAAARRRSKEAKVVPREAADSQDLGEVLDEELSCLPEPYRAAILLCDLEGKTRKEAARELGCAEGTIASRLARGRGLLAQRLSRRGLPLAGPVAVALGANAVACVPAPLVLRTVKALAGHAAWQVAALAEGVLKVMLFNKLRKVAAVVLVLSALGLGGGGLVGLSAARPGDADAPRPAKAVAPGEKAKRPPVPGAIPLQFDRKIDLGVRSKPVKVNEQDLHILSIGTGTFHRTGESRLTATLNVGVVQHAKVTYQVYAAVFDAKGRLLATASHKEEVQRIRLGRTPMLLRRVELDFGISRDFAEAAYVVVAVSDPEVPKS